MKNIILDILSKNARITNKEIAVMLDTTEEEIESTISELEKDGILLGFKALINREKLDDNYVCADKTADDIISRFPFVKSVFLMSGGFDILVIIEGLSMKEIALFVMQNLAPLDSVISTSTHFVLKTYKKSGKVVDEIKKDERYGM